MKIFKCDDIFNFDDDSLYSCNLHVWSGFLKLINNSWSDQPIIDVYFGEVDETLSYL